MAVFDTNHRVDQSLGRGAFSLAGVLNAFVAWKEARVTQRALSALTNEQLEDIGLTRWDIAEICRPR